MDKEDKDYKLAKKILFNESHATIVTEDEIIRLAELFKKIREEGREEGRIEVQFSTKYGK